MSRLRRVMPASLVGVAVVLLWFALRADPVRVDLAPVTRGRLEVTIDEEGRTRVRQRFTVAAPVSGRLQRIGLDEGDAVARDEEIARIDPAPLDPRAQAGARARLETALAVKREAAARDAQAASALQQAERELRRARELRKAGTLSAQQLEQAELARTSRAGEREAAREAANAAAHEVDVARAALLAADDPSRKPDDADAALVVVRAPVAGRVLRVLEESERVVSVGTPLLEIGDPAHIEIVVDVLSADAVRIADGAEIRVEAWGGEHPLAARIRRIEPSGFTKLSALGVEEQRVNVIGEFVDAPATLGDGYRIEARIVIWHGDDVLRVPASALFRQGEAWNVFVVDGRVVRLREVTIGARGRDAAEVLSGIGDGEIVVLHPTDRLADGVRVRPF